MDNYNFPDLPDKLKNGLNEYRKLWNSGLKKKANEILRQTMLFYDSLPADIHNMFISIICGKVCNNRVGLFEYKNLPYEISVRLSKELACYVKDGTLPQARWYCELFGDLDDKLNVYQKNKDDLLMAELLFSALIYTLDFGAHHFPEYSCIDRTDFDLAYSYGKEILNNHNINEDMRQEFEYYVKLYGLFYSWDKISDFTVFCEENGLKFDEIKSFYYN